MLYVYLVAAVALIPILNNFFDILRQSYSWWLVPVLIVVFFVGLTVLHLTVLLCSFLFTSFNSPRERGAKYYRFILELSLPMILSIARVKVDVSGMDTENIPKDRRLMFVCNHQHDFDPIIMLSVFKGYKIGFIGKKDIIKKMPLVAKAMHKLYCLFIDRENDREAAKTIIEAIKFIKTDKASIGVFPEGYTSKSCELLPFRNGVFKIALKTNAPIVVCAINNTREIPKNICRKTTHIKLKIEDIIYPENYNGMNTAELSNIVHEKMEKAFNEIK